MDNDKNTLRSNDLENVSGGYDLPFEDDRVKVRCVVCGEEGLVYDPSLGPDSKFTTTLCTNCRGLRDAEIIAFMKDLQKKDD